MNGMTKVICGRRLLHLLKTQEEQNRQEYFTLTIRNGWQVVGLVLLIEIVPVPPPPLDLYSFSTLSQEEFSAKW